MEDSRLVLSPSPHVRDEDTTQKIMLTVVAALIPVWAAATYFFGFNSIRLVFVSIIAAVGSEAVFLALRRKPVTVWDGSALVTGMLLGLSLPPTLPTWMAVLGSFVAIVIGKQVFGGLGANPFNPALVGRA
ncbi:MAG TPA: RnfABCDGE type electron transport complex subunit D, partial [Limnochordia bacterium]|nr:RnfABCDGE type electron transport complex subunit D [Limnochordia bacterium]